MAEDIDDLLDEVESKFVKDKGKDRRLSNTKTTRRKAEDDVIDQLLDDISDGPEEKCNIVRTKSLPSKIHHSHPRPSKCFPLYIGGTSVSQGYGTSVNKRSCDKLRCTTCDFKVVSFENFHWHPSTDYLFLRNNAPDFDRLSPNLKTKNGYRSYCCQCSHISVNSLTDVKELAMKWVCGGQH